MFMKNDLQRSADSYATDELADTPFLRGREEWDKRMKSTSGNTKAWPFVSSVLAITLFGSVYMNISQLSQRTIEAIYVEVERQGGNVTNVGPINPVDFSKNQAVVSRELRDLVRWIRGVPADLVVARENWQNAYTRFSPTVAERFNAQLDEHAFDDVGRITRQVNFSSVLPVGKNTFQLHWVETEYDKHANPTGSNAYTGLFSYYFQVPKTKQEILSNPLGFKISDYQFREDLQ